MNAIISNGKLTLIAATPIPPVEGQESQKGIPSFDLIAYTGVKMTVGGFYTPVIVDLSTIRATLPIPILRDHNPELIVGHAEKTAVSSNDFKLSGKVSGQGPHVDEIISLDGREFPWQVSIGGNPSRLQYVERGQTATVNGTVHDGPFLIAFGVSIREVSILPIGADQNTSVTIALSAKNAETENALQLEAARIDLLKGLCVKYRDDGSVFLRAINEKWTVEQTETYLIQKNRPTISVRSGVTEMNRADILAAALFQSAKYEKVEKLEGMFTPQILESAHKQYRGRLSLQQLFIEAAMIADPSARFTNFRSHAKDILRAAFSTKDISGILSNLANKYILAGFNAVEQTWRAVTRIRSVPDFKESSGYRGIGAFTYEPVSAMGEIAHGVMTEATYGNKADTFGKMFAITRQDMYNDDLGVVSEIPRGLGRGGALKLNKVFWIEFLNNSTFFTAGNNNVSAGVLGIDGLNNANKVFKALKDEVGEFTGSEPAILLTPVALEVTGRQLYTDTKVVSGITTPIPDGNPWAGKFVPYSSRYLSDTAMGGTQSAIAYYLLASPDDVPVIEVAFLEGQETPIVEEAAADFDTLGVQMRGYFDFGVRKQEFRGGVRSTGA